MPPPAVEFSPIKFTSGPPTSTSAGACGSADGPAVSQTLRRRFVKGRRHFRSRTVPSGQQSSSACDSSCSVPTGSDKPKIGGPNGFPECSGNVDSSSVEPVEVRALSEDAAFSFNSAGRIPEGKLNSLGNDAGSGKKAGSCFVFGSSQFHPASIFSSECKGFREKFGELNLDDNGKMKAETAAGSQEVKSSDGIFNFNSGGSMNPDNGLESGAFVFTGNTRRKGSACLKSQNDRVDDTDTAKAADVNSEVISEASFSLGVNASQLCHGNSSAAAVEGMKNPYAAAENDSKPKMVDENVFTFGSKGNLSSQPAGISVCKPSVFVANPDSPFLKTNLFSSSSNCCTPMDFSPYQECSVDHQSSQEKQTNEHVSSNCAHKMSCMTESATGEVDVSGSSGDSSGKAASVSTSVEAASGAETAACQPASSACQPESNRFCSNGLADNDVQFRFSSGSEKQDQGSFAFSIHGSLNASPFRGKHHHRSSNVERNSASSNTVQGATVENVSSSLRGQGGCASDKEGLLKEAPRGKPLISKKLRPRLVKLRKHSHGRSETVSTQEKAFISNPFSAVPDGLSQVKLNYADSSTSDNPTPEEVNCSVRNAGFVFGGSGRTSASKLKASEEECLSSECGKHDNIASSYDSNYGGSQSVSQSYSEEFSSGVNGSDFGEKKIFGYSGGTASFCDSEAISMCDMRGIGEKISNLNSSNCGKGRTGVESVFVFGSSRVPTDPGSDNGVFIFKGSSKGSSTCGESSAAKVDHWTKPNSENFECVIKTSSSGSLGLDEGGRDASSLSSVLPDGMQKLSIHDIENLSGNHRNEAPGNGESPFVFRSGTEASDINADNFPSSSSDLNRNPNTCFPDGVENGNNIRSVSKDHIMFGSGNSVHSGFAATSSSNLFIFQRGSTENFNVMNGGHHIVNGYTFSSEVGREDELSSMSPSDGRGSSVDSRMLDQDSCLFPELNNEFKFSEQVGSIRETESGKQAKSMPCSRAKLNMVNQNIPREDDVQVKSETPYCFSAMDFSPCNEHEAANQFSRETSAGPAGDFLQSFSMAGDGSDSNKCAFEYPKSHCNLFSENLCSRVGNGISSVKDSDVNLSRTEENPTRMQFSFALGVDKANQGGFMFSASTSTGDNSLRRKRLHKKKGCTQRTSVSFVSHTDSNTSTTFAAQEASGPRGDASCVHEDHDKSSLNGHGKCEQNEVSSSASIQEACEKWRFRGNQAYKNGHFSRAERFYTKGIDSVPSHETSGCCLKPLLLCYSNRAATRMSLGRLREAINDCTRAAALDRNFVKVQLREANCHLVLGEIEKAIDCFHNCLESGANVCLDRRLVIEAADGLQRAQKVAEHIKLSTKLLEDKSVDAESRALEIISEAMSISKFSEKLLQMKAEALYMLQKYEEVIQLCEQSLIIADKNLHASDVPRGSDNVDGSKSEGKLRVRLWRFFLMAKSNFCLGRLEEALDLLQKVEMTESISDKSLSESVESAILLSSTICKLLDSKNSGNEAFRSKRYTEAVEHYTAALSSSGESRPFAAICFCNRAAAHQALGQVADAVADCSLAIALDGNYAKAVSRRATLHELIRHYEQAARDNCRLISILENQSNQKTKASGGPSNRANELRKAYKHKSSMEEESKKGTPLDFYLILGVKTSDTAADIKKAYRKAALRHHPDKVGQFLRGDSGYEVRLWKEIAEVVREDADRLFKIIGEAYAVLSDTSKREQYDHEEEIRKAPKEGSGYSSYFRDSSDYYGFPSQRSSSRRYAEENWKTYGNSRYRW